MAITNGRPFRNPCLAAAFYVIAVGSFARTARGSLLQVSPGDATDLAAKLKQCESGDTILVPPGIYSLGGPDPDDEWSQLGDLCKHLESNMEDGYDVTILGGGASPDETVAFGAFFHYCDGYVLVENMSLVAGCDGGALFEDDYDRGLAVRNCNLVGGSAPRDVIFDHCSHTYAVIGSHLRSPGLNGDTAVDMEDDNLIIIDSKISGFATGVDGDPREGHELTLIDVTFEDNGSDCGERACGDFRTRDPNTPRGENVKLGNLRDILRVDPWDYKKPDYAHPVKMVFPSVKTAGETTVYRVPSRFAYPAAGMPAAATFGTRILYYQFDSSAALRKKPKLLFEKSVVDVNFPPGESFHKIMVLYPGKDKWSNMPVTDKGSHYQVTFKKKKLVGLVAIIGVVS